MIIFMMIMIIIMIIMNIVSLSSLSCSPCLSLSFIIAITIIIIVIVVVVVIIINAVVVVVVVVVITIRSHFGSRHRSATPSLPGATVLHGRQSRLVRGVDLLVMRVFQPAGSTRNRPQALRRPGAARRDPSPLP